MLYHPVWASLEEYRNLDFFWKMTSGVQLGSTVDTRSRVSLRSLQQSIVRRLPPGVEVNWVVQGDEMHMFGPSMDKRSCVSLWRVISHVFPRECGPRIPRSVPGAVHTWTSGHYFHGPVYLAVTGSVFGCSVFSAMLGSTVDTCSCVNQRRLLE